MLLRVLLALFLPVLRCRSTEYELCSLRLEIGWPSEDSDWSCYGTIALPTSVSSGYIHIRAFGTQFKSILRLRSSVPDVGNYFTGRASDFKVSGSVTRDGVHLTIRSQRGTYFVDGKADGHRFLAIVGKKKNLVSELCPGKSFAECFRTLERKHEATGRVCGVQLAADHTFYRYMHFNRANVVQVMTDHLTRVDSWFRGTDFDGDGRRDNLSLQVMNITIWTHPPPDLEDNATDLSLLEAFTRMADPGSCVALLFVHRPMNVTLGFSRTGGVCTSRGALVSSLGGDGYSLVPMLLTTTVAHEIGHLFGSGHDPTSSKCTPLEGYYLMYGGLVYPNKSNNFKFSSCSTKVIAKTLTEKGDCLQEGPSKPKCGNGVKEAGEECDGGAHADEPCCSTNCLLSPGSACSPQNGPCCSERCDFVSASKRRQCGLPSQECRKIAFCNGASAECPVAEALQDGTPCEGTSRTCKFGECSSTVCFHHLMQDCLCATPEEECHVCCRRSVSDQCVPAYKLGLVSTRGRNYTRYHRTVCAQGIAFCNREGNCQQ